MIKFDLMLYIYLFIYTVQRLYIKDGIHPVVSLFFGGGRNRLWQGILHAHIVYCFIFYFTLYVIIKHKIMH